MEATGALFFAVAGLLVAPLPVSGGATRNISTSFVVSQMTVDPSIGSSPSFRCLVEELPFFRSSNDISLYKRQASDAAWVKIVNGALPDPRYKLVRMEQERGTADGYQLTIENFRAADVGAYLCNVTLANATNIAGTTSAEISLSLAPQQTRVIVTSSADASSEGVFWYQDQAVTTECTVDFVSSTDAEVQVFYNGVNHTAEFSMTRNLSWVGTADAMREPRRRINLVSQTFTPVAGMPRPIECIALDRNGSMLGRGNATLVLKTLPQVQCFQSGVPPAYLHDLNVMITCNALNYDWKPKTSRFSWSFMFPDNGELTTVTIDDFGIVRADRWIVEDAQNARQSLRISKITSDVARFTFYNVTLMEDSNAVTMTTFNLSVNKRSRAADWGSNAARPSTAVLGAHVFWLSLIALLAL